MNKNDCMYRLHIENIYRQMRRDSVNGKQRTREW